MGWFARADEWSESNTQKVDMLLAGGLALVLVPVGAIFGLGLETRGGTVLVSPVGAGLLTLALVVPLGWRRSHPVASVVAVYVVALAHLTAGIPLVPGDLAVLVALYSVTAYGPGWAHRTAIASASVGTFAVGASLASHDDPLSLVQTMLATGMFGTAVLLAVWALGLVRRARYETVEALRDRARRLEVERDQQAQIATAAERSRIAREMHDIVAHSLSVIIAQADGGRYVSRQDPQAAVRTLETVSDTGRAALADMRRLLGVLRTDPASGSATPTRPARALGTTGRARAWRFAGEVPVTKPEAPGGSGSRDVDSTDPDVAATHVAHAARLGPQPGTDDLDGLVARTRAAGLPVSLVAVGASDSLPLGLGLTVYRIVQEALTNVLKHAGPGARATVLVRWRDDSIDLEVQDDGRGAAATSDAPGYGLLGMRERVEVYGGTLRSGPRPGGGFSVRATIPRALPAGRLASADRAPGDEPAPLTED